MSIRTRFAPSPTGYLHIGGARTALFAWLYARQQAGKFILRIEDTDQARSTEASAQAILDAMVWLGLTIDEGPIYQSQRLPVYQEVVNRLLQTGQAYRCDCSLERLEALRHDQMRLRQKPKYDGYCRNRHLAADSASVVRFRNPEVGSVSFKDLVFGDVMFANAELDDLIIQRSDGLPTYNLAVTVDDWEMKITHVIRGSDHINNTPRQIHLFQALGASLPQFAHLPMILNEEGKPLSKRRDAVSVLWYREAGYLSQALCNYLVRLGWSHGDQEIFSMKAMIDLFGFSTIQRTAACLNPPKLLWLNHHYLSTLPDAVIAAEFAQALKRHALPVPHERSLVEIVQVQKDRCKTLEAMVEQSRYLFEDITYQAAVVAPYFTPTLIKPFNALIRSLKAIGPSQWEAKVIHDILKQIVNDHQLRFPQLAQPIRVALTGYTTSPSIDQSIYLLGQQKTLQRLQAALDWIETNL